MWVLAQQWHLNIPPINSTPVTLAPLLPLPVSTQKDSTVQFTEEFEFEAMNEKFIKDEVWGHFGNAKQRDKTEGLEDNAPEQAVGEEEGYGLSSNFDPKPVYKKDDFFDTISCNSLNPKSKECTEVFCPSERISEALITGAGPGPPSKHAFLKLYGSSIIQYSVHQISVFISTYSYKWNLWNYVDIIISR